MQYPDPFTQNQENYNLLAAFNALESAGINEGIAAYGTTPDRFIEMLRSGILPPITYDQMQRLAAATRYKKIWPNGMSYMYLALPFLEKLNEYRPSLGKQILARSKQPDMHAFDKSAINSAFDYASDRSAMEYFAGLGVNIDGHVASWLIEQMIGHNVVDIGRDALTTLPGYIKQYTLDGDREPLWVFIDNSMRDLVPHITRVMKMGGVVLIFSSSLANSEQIVFTQGVEEERELLMFTKEPLGLGALEGIQASNLAKDYIWNALALEI